MIRIIHSADWQLGKPFGRFEVDVRASLTEARFEAIDAIGRAATEHGARHVLVAGDVFDTEGPEDRTIIQAVSRMERHPCRWWLLPGNHDYARNRGLWERVRAKHGSNIQVLDEPVPQEIEGGVWLLPAPLTHRHTLEDPTEIFDVVSTPGSDLRIGIAHGSIREFGSQGDTQNQIAPDRVQRSGLDYLALGDWHGMLSAGPRTWYSGTPETDRFQRDEPGHALLIELEPGREPVLTALRTGKFQWLSREWRVNDFTAFEAERDQLLAAVDPAATLLQLTLVGITSLTDRVAMLGSLEGDLTHRLRHLAFRADDLVARPSEEDLAMFTAEGMLGAAAAKLHTKAEAGGAEGLVAQRALERLFVEHAKGEAA